MYEFINNKNEINDQSTIIQDVGLPIMKCKGIPQKCLDPKMYSNYKTEELKCSFSGLKKVHKTLTKKQEEKGVNRFNIINVTENKTFMKTDYDKMKLVDQFYFPKGFGETSSTSSSVLEDEVENIIVQDDEECYYI